MVMGNFLENMKQLAANAGVPGASGMTLPELVKAAVALTAVVVTTVVTTTLTVTTVHVKDTGGDHEIEIVASSDEAANRKFRIPSLGADKYIAATDNPDGTIPGGGGGGAPVDATYIVQTASTGLSAEQALGALGSGVLKNTTGTGVLSIAAAGTDYEYPLTFGAGLSRATNTVTVNTSQNIATLSNLTTDGFLKTSGGTGALSVDTTTYLSSIADGSISTAKIVDANVTAAKLVNGGVMTGDVTTTFPAVTIGNNAITTAKILDANVTAAKLVNGGVFTGDATTTFPAITIGNGAITNAKLAGSIDLATKVTGVLPTASAPVEPSVHVYNNAATTLTNGSFVGLAFNTERFDTDTMHSVATNTDRITFTTAGKYMVGCSVQFYTNSTGDRIVKILKAGTEMIRQSVKAAGGTHTTIQPTALVDMAANDYITVEAYQSSGGSLDVNASTSTDHSGSDFWAVRVSP
jgi:hypothetical protein